MGNTRFKGGDDTRIVWNSRYEVHMCEKCNAIFHYSFSFRFCPYCHRRIIKTDERQTPTSPGVATWR